MISGQVWPRFGLPKAPVYDFEAGKLTADDFVLRGLQLNDHFINDSNNDWKHQGMLFGSAFIGYNEYGVSVDKKEPHQSCTIKYLHANTSRYCDGRY